MNELIITRLFVAAVLSIPILAHAEVDCSALDPRMSVSKEREAKIAGSVDTLYKIAKVGGNIEARIKDEIVNVQQGVASDERSIVKLRAIYLFCGMIANSPDIPIDKKVTLFGMMLTTAERGPERPVTRNVGTPPKPTQNAVTPDAGRTIPPTIGRQQRTILYEDTFDKEHRLPESQFPNSGRTLYHDGWYILQNTTENTSFFMRLNEAGYFPAAVRIQVDLRLNAGPMNKPYGLLLGATDEQFQNAYGVLLRGDGATEIVRWAGNVGSMEMYLPPHPAVRTGFGVTNSLSVEIQDTDLVYSVNGTQIGRYKASSKIQGYVGLHTDYPGLDVGFNNLKITQ